MIWWEWEDVLLLLEWEGGGGRADWKSGGKQAKDQEWEEKMMI